MLTLVFGTQRCKLLNSGLVKLFCLQWLECKYEWKWSHLNLFLFFSYPSSSLYPSGMSHEPKSTSLGMISTATRTTATVSPLTPSPISGTVLTNGNTASQASHSGFAAALRKLARQAEEPRGGCGLFFYHFWQYYLIIVFMKKCNNSDTFLTVHNQPIPLGIVVVYFCISS